MAIATATWVLFSMVAVAGPGGVGMTEGQGAEGEDSVWVTIENENTNEATIYLYHRDRRTFLGAVPNETTRRLAFEWVEGEFQFIIDFIGAGRSQIFASDHTGRIPCLLTEKMTAEEGQHLLLVVAADLDHQRPNGRCAPRR